MVNKKQQAMGKDAGESLKTVPTPTPDELAKKYGVKLDVVLSQVEVGMKVEKEHTTDDQVACEIALDHLGEDLWYYEKLASGVENSGISESMDKPAEYNWLQKNDALWKAAFTVPGDGGETLNYLVMIKRFSPNERKKFRITNPETRFICFSLSSETQSTTIYAVNNVKKSVLMVFATVYAILKEFLKTNRGSAVYFWAKSSDSKRIALYRTFANRLRSEGYVVKELDDIMDGTELFCVAQRGVSVDESIDKKPKKVKPSVSDDSGKELTKTMDLPEPKTK